MPTDLADFIDGTPGRFVPAEMQGQLVEAEHLARYMWASAFADGRRILDAGCGLAYGSAILAHAGATEVTAVDTAAEVIEAAAADAPTGVRCQVADIRELPFADASFDLVVCFEVIEHIAEQDRALDEFRRVLTPGGMLVISSPNPTSYVQGNPHHVHELTPDELSAQLARRWSGVRLFQQHDFTATTILTEPAAQLDRGAPVTDAVVNKLHARAGGQAPYSVALASDAALPDQSELVVLSATVEVSDWVKVFAEQQQILHAQADALTEVQRTLADRRELLRQLAESQSVLAEHEALKAQVADTHADQMRLVEKLDAANQRATSAENLLRSLYASPSWRITRPLRLVKRLMRTFGR